MESLDSLSRAEISEAVTSFMQIINAGITLTKSKPMKFYFRITQPDKKSRYRSFIRHITAFTLENPKEPSRPAYLNLMLKMSHMNQGLQIIKSAIEEKVGEAIELDEAYPLW